MIWRYDLHRVGAVLYITVLVLNRLILTYFTWLDMYCLACMAGLDRKICVTVQTWRIVEWDDGAYEPSVS